MVELPSCPNATDPDQVYPCYMVKSLQYFAFYEINTKFMAGKFIAHHFVNWRLKELKTESPKPTNMW